MDKDFVSSVMEMRDMARSAGKKLYIRAEGLSGVLGVFEVFPGGRSIFWSSDKGKVFERKCSEALQDVIFRVNSDGA